jgi:hypothetical protein
VKEHQGDFTFLAVPYTAGRWDPPKWGLLYRTLYSGEKKICFNRGAVKRISVLFTLPFSREITVLLTSLFTSLSFQRNQHPLLQTGGFLF